MISKAYNISEVARRYFEKKGENLTKQEALNRFRFVRNKDKLLLLAVIRDIYDEGVRNIISDSPKQTPSPQPQ